MQNTKRGRLLGFLITAWLVVALDQLAKFVAVQNLKPGQYVQFLGDVVRFVLAYNDSAAFSIGFGATWIFAIVSSLAALAIIWFFPRLETLGWSITGGLALGGVVGNLIDRLIRSPGFGRGEVIDFIALPFHFPIFNIADMAIVSVAAIVILRIMRGTSLGKAPAKRS